MNKTEDAKMVTVIVINDDGTRELKRVDSAKLQEAKRAQKRLLSQTCSTALSKAMFG